MLPVSLSLFRLQHTQPDELAGGRVLFEYPLAASEEPCLWKLRSIDGMRCVRCDQCQFGMMSVDSECEATGFMTNDEHIAEAVKQTLLWWTRQHPVVEWQSEIFVQMYPPRLLAAILRGLRQSMRAAGRGEAQRMMGQDRQPTIAAVEAGPTLEEPELLSLPDNVDGDQEFRDRSTGLPLIFRDGQESKRALHATHGGAEVSGRQRSGRVHD